MSETEDNLTEIEQHLKQIPDRHKEAFLKLTAAGKDATLVRAGIDYIVSDKAENHFCEAYDVEPSELMKMTHSILSFTDVDDGLDDLADSDLFEMVFSLSYSERRRIAELANTDEIDGKSTQLEIATWYANNYSKEVIELLYELES